MSVGGLGSAIIGTVPSWEAGGTMPISGWPMYGIELLIIGSQRNILLRLYIYIYVAVPYRNQILFRCLFQHITEFDDAKGGT